MPIALIEAQLAGIPVIATNVGSTSEVVEDKITGYLKDSTVDELVVAINQLLSKPALINKMGDEAKKRATKKFDLQKMIRTHLKIYKELTF